MPGAALFEDTLAGDLVAPCAGESAADDELAAECQAFLDKNEKAALQWDLEKRFAAFDSSFK